MVVVIISFMEEIACVEHRGWSRDKSMIITIIEGCMIRNEE